METENLNKRVIFEYEGNLCTLIPAPTSQLTLNEIIEKDIPRDANGNLVSYSIVERDIIPTDRTFRNAWEKNGDSIDVDMPKAKEITKARLREERKPLMELEDIKFMQAQESGVSTTAIVVEKQRLRDITLAVDSATTLDELKALRGEKP